jgi:DNA-binding MarR family transcriptional regulator
VSGITQLAVLQAVEEHYILDYDMIASDLAYHLKCADSTASRWAKKLVEKGLLNTMICQVEGKFKLSLATAYDLTEAGQKLLEEAEED